MADDLETRLTLLERTAMSKEAVIEREEKLLDPYTLHAINMLRRTLSSMHHVDAMEQLTKQLSKFKSNREFITLIASSRED